MLHSKNLQNSIGSALFIAFLRVFHKLVHWLLRFKVMERLIVYTSLTKYKWWGRRYKALKPGLHIETTK